MNELQATGEEILETTGLLEGLSDFGEAHLVGNMAFKTTVKPDIDVQIYPNGKFDVAAEGIKKYLEGIGCNRIVIRKLKISKKTLILSKFDVSGTTWNVDIALTNKSKNYLFDSYQYYLDNKERMTEETRERIIEFKKDFCQNKLVFDNPSYYIYRAVLEEGVKTKEEMAEHLKAIEEKMKREKSS